MSRKRKKSRQGQQPSLPAPAQAPAATPALRFNRGDAVTVKKGIVDPDFPDIPLGGWTGKVIDIDRESNPPLVLVEWIEDTIRQIHPAFRDQCEDEGLEIETMWLDPGDLEPAGHGPVLIDQPILPERDAGESDDDEADDDEADDEVPIDQDQARRILTALGHAGDPGPLPPVNEENLRQYHRYLSGKLTFPAKGKYYDDPLDPSERGLPVTLNGLGTEEQNVGEFGLLVETGVQGEPGEGKLMLPLSKIEILGDEAPRRLVMDYTWWFSMGRMEAMLGEGAGAKGDPRVVWRALRTTAMLGAVGGAIAGAVIATHNIQIALWISVLLFGVLGYLVGTRFGLLMGVMNQIPNGASLGGIFGALGGGLVGVLAAALAMTCLGSVPGSIAGNLLGRGLAALGWRPLSRFTWTFFGAGVGALVMAYLTDPEAMLRGIGWGALIGAGVTLFLIVGLMGAVLAATTRRE
jgi:hypothetical protein